MKPQTKETVFIHMEYICIHLLIYCRKINCLFVKDLWGNESTILFGRKWRLRVDAKQQGKNTLSKCLFRHTSLSALVSIYYATL